MIVLFGIFLLSLQVITAVAIVRTANLFVAVMLTAIFSLLLAANFFLLDAADVALTEAAVGAGVTTVILLSALGLTAAEERARKRTEWVAVGVVAVTAMILIYATFDKPRLGDPQAPVHQHVAPWYLEMTPELIDIPNVVTAVLGSYRGYDTLGEVFVVFAAAIGVLFVLGGGERSAAEGRGPPGLRHHLIPRIVGHVLIPFIVLFGLYVQFHGEYGPGGGFQAGAIIATGFILHALLEGERTALAAFPHSAMTALIVGGTLLYVGVGVVSMLLGGEFLNYSVLRDDPVKGQQLGIILIELGVGMAVCGALLTIFHAYAARGH